MFPKTIKPSFYQDFNRAKKTGFNPLLSGFRVRTTRQWGTKKIDRIHQVFDLETQEIQQGKRRARSTLEAFAKRNGKQVGWIRPLVRPYWCQNHPEDYFSRIAEGGEFDHDRGWAIWFEFIPWISLSPGDRVCTADGDGTIEFLSGSKGKAIIWVRLDSPRPAIAATFLDDSARILSQIEQALFKKCQWKPRIFNDPVEVSPIGKILSRQWFPQAANAIVLPEECNLPTSLVPYSFEQCKASSNIPAASAS